MFVILQICWILNQYYVIFQIWKSCMHTNEYRYLRPKSGRKIWTQAFCLNNRSNSYTRYRKWTINSSQQTIHLINSWTLKIWWTFELYELDKLYEPINHFTTRYIPPGRHFTSPLNSISSNCEESLLKGMLSWMANSLTLIPSE